MENNKEGEECVDLTTYDLQSVVIHMGVLEVKNHMDMEDEPAMHTFCNTLDGATVVSFI